MPRGEHSARIPMIASQYLLAIIAAAVAITVIARRGRGRRGEAKR